MNSNQAALAELLSDSEWEVMKVLWHCAPAPANTIAEHLPQWHPKTVRTMLLRLQKKGVVTHEIKDGIQHFIALLSRDDCQQQATQNFLQRVFDGALSPMVAHFSKQQKLSPQDREALLKLLQDDTGENNE